ncbi:hypothetical protein [Wenyingzhuangia sp. IMCC45467]
MKKQITFLLMLLLTLVTTKMQAQAKQVLYLNNANAQQEDGTSAPGDDAITRMLDGDANFEVTTGTVDGSGVVTPSDLTPYDLIIIQESLSSGNSVMQPSGSLGLKNLTTPVIYCKSEAFRNGKAVTTGASIAKNKSSVSVTVDPSNQSNVLFNGIDFSGGNDVRLFLNTANDNGTVASNKTGLKVLNNIEIGNASGGTLATTPEVVDPATSVVINHIPANTQLGTVATDKASVDVVILAFGYGPQVRGDGRNITSEALTIWRNAAYMLTGMTVPTTLYENTEEASKILYVNQSGVLQGEGASALGQDPVIKMFMNDPNFYVEYVESDQSGTEIPELSNFDLVIAQETFSSGANIFKPGGKLSVKDVSIPIIYNKTWAFRDGRAVTDSDAAVTATQNITVTVTDPAHALFSGIDLSGGNNIRIFKEATATDDGSVGGSKGIDVLNGLDISGTTAGSLASTPEVTDTSKSFVINYIPSGTQLGTDVNDVLSVDAVALSFSYGAMVMGDGANITPEALTIWRNAAYLLVKGAAEVPTTLVENSAYEAPKKVLYVNQLGVGQGVGASAPGEDPVIKMLIADANIDVTYVESDQLGTEIPELSGFDLVIAQETFSSGAALFQSGGKLAVKDVTIPIIYNKTWAFRNGKAITDADAAVTATQNVSITATISAHPLFNGIDFSESNDIRIFKEAIASDDGSVGGNKGIDVLNGLDIAPSGTGSLATTPEVTDVSQALVVNHILSGTQLGTDASDVLGVDAVMLSFSYGAMIMGDGTNITPEALTIWRNAVYLLTYGVSGVPTTLVENPLFTLGIDKVGDYSAVTSTVKSKGSRVFVSDVKYATKVNIYSITGELVKTVETKEDMEFEFQSGVWIATIKTVEGVKSVKFITN